MLDKMEIKVRWYFDLVLPFSYLHLKQFRLLPADLTIEGPAGLQYAGDVAHIQPAHVYRLPRSVQILNAPASPVQG